MGRQSAGLRFQFDESSDQESRESGVGSLELEGRLDVGTLAGSHVEGRSDACRMCRGTGIRREQRMPDEAIAEMGTFCLCEAGRGKWGNCVSVMGGKE
jgi:hypothetical protein